MKAYLYTETGRWMYKELYMNVYSSFIPKCQKLETT